MFRKVTTSAALLAVSIALGLLVLEAGVRFVFPQYDPSGQIRFTRLADGTPVGPPNETLIQIKNTGDFSVPVTFNALGLRDDKNLSDAGRDSIFVVGDSFAFGWGVAEDERFSDVLQTLTGRDVFNIAIPTDLDGYKKLVAYAKRNAAEIGTLIIGLCMENDVRHYGEEIEPPQETPDEFSVGLGELKHWLRNNSALYFFLTTIVQRQPWLREQFIRAGLIVPNLEGIQMPELDPEAVASTIDRIEKMASDQDTIVLIIPSRWLWVGEPERSRAVSDLHRMIVADLEARGLTVVDPRPLMERGGAPLDYHFGNDGHWRPEIHKIAAEMLAEKLR